MLRALQHFDEDCDSGTIDVPDRCQVERQPAYRRQDCEKSTAQVRRRAEIHLSFHLHNLRCSHVTNGDLHVVFFLNCLLATRRFPSGDSSYATLSITVLMM